MNAVNQVRGHQRRSYRVPTPCLILPHFGPQWVVPIYEFQCLDCSEKFQLLVGMTAESEANRCPKCGSAKLQKLVSKFTQGRDEDARLSEIADQMDVSGEPESYSGARRLAREMGAALDDKASDDMEFMLDEGIGGD